ncbi:MAG: hypothetical protein NTW21_44300 [Verrucomicrobia bacterium]|nr:hypothetical protein [Verrucomicrobiota bacterium]
MPFSRGGNLTPPVLAEAKRRLDAHAAVRAYGSSFSSLLNKAAEALSPFVGTGSPDHFCRVAPSVPCPSPRLWYVTTLSALQYGFAARGSWQKSLYDWLNAADPAACPVQPTRGMIGLGRPDSVFWLSDQSPLEFLAANGLAAGTDDAAWAVMRELALPGFETQTRRQAAMGLVCVEFAASLLVDRGNVAQVWKPTALDALNYKGYCFLPGRHFDPHGLTWPLRKDLRNHRCRDGLREFVHPRIEVPALDSGKRTVHLLGFLDPVAETTWHSHRPS